VAQPIYDRVPLLVVSRALFGSIPSTGEVLKSWPRLMVRRLWFALVMGRFSPARSLSMPVSELEGLRGADYRQRVSLLARNGGAGATMATIAGLFLEMVAGLGVVLLVFMMLPSHVSDQWSRGIGEMLSYSEFYEVTDGLLWMIAIVRLLSFMLMEPFYVSAGFALYINSRTMTEGWDIELAFKRLGARLNEAANLAGKLPGKLPSKGAGVPILMCCLLAMGLMVTSPRASAQSQDETKQQIQELMEHEDFTIHHRIKKVPAEQSDPWLDGSAIPALFGKLIFIVVLTLVIAGLAYLIYANRHVFSREDGDAATAGRAARTREVMGMQVTPESLPDDVIAAARKAWQGGDYQRALSYLYRGAIVWLIHRADLPIAEGDTEGDCLRHVQSLQNQKLSMYFSELSSSWVDVAYGEQQPDEQAMERLCEAWPFGKEERRAP